MPRGAADTVPVWDRPVRLLHWTLVASVALGWLTTGWHSAWHRPIGYVGLAALVLRLLWGWFGSRHARFAQFLRGPRATLAYARALLAQREPRHLGHNPLGGWMIVALLACLGGLALTGWLYTTDWLWGDETVEAIHRVLAWTIVVLAALHVAGVLFTGRRQHENLVAAMFSGRKRTPAGDDVA